MIFKLKKRPYYICRVFFSDPKKLWIEFDHPMAGKKDGSCYVDLIKKQMEEEYLFGKLMLDKYVLLDKDCYPKHPGRGMSKVSFFREVM